MFFAIEFNLRYGNYRINKSNSDIILHKYFMLFDENERYQSDTVRYFSLCLEKNESYDGAYWRDFLVGRI